MRYILDGNSVLQQIPDTLWTHIDDEIFPIKNIEELPVALKEGDVYRETVLSIGTSIKVCATDNTFYVCFRMKDGQEGSIRFAKNRNELLTVGGSADRDLFEMLPYTD